MESRFDEMRNVREAFQALSAGNSSVMLYGEEASLEVSKEGSFVVTKSNTWKVSGSERLTVEKVSKAPARDPSTPAADDEAICDECGSSFVKSKFNPYFTKCPDCRRKKKAPAAEARAFNCKECGVDFKVSKFQPYLNPERCPKCAAKASRKRYLDGKKAQPSGDASPAAPS